MGLRINTNLESISAHRNLSVVTGRLSNNFRRLSSGLRIANASDDAAGLAISERLRAQIASTNQAIRNSNDGVSLVQTAESALNEVSSILVRLRTLAVQSNNGTVNTDDKETLDQEFQGLIGEIDRIAQNTTFNRVQLLDGTQGSVDLQIGIGTTIGVDTVTLSLDSTLAADLGLTGLDIGSGGDAFAAIDAVDNAVNLVTQTRGDLGSLQNRLESNIENLQNYAVSLSAAESRIRDVDVAQETADLTRNAILQQAAISVLAQANVQPQNALALLQR
jgi:flagellin